MSTDLLRTTLDTRGKIVAVVKGPMADDHITLPVPEELTVADAARYAANVQATSPTRQRVAQNLQRELRESPDYFAITEGGVLNRVDPSTPLKKIAFPREVQTPSGWREMHVAAIEVQNYCKVGR